jgi:hypothetical protein
MIQSVDNWRKEQLSWFSEPTVIQQDHDLIQYIKNNKLTCAIGRGPVDYFSNVINLQLTGSCNFCIYLVNDHNVSIDLNLLIEDVNHIIQHELDADGILYLAINKFLIFPKVYDLELPIDHDDAIKVFLTKKIKGHLVNYYSGANDNGTNFNWVHPLTRFYFKASAL